MLIAKTVSKKRKKKEDVGKKKNNSELKYPHLQEDGVLAPLSLTCKVAQSLLFRNKFEFKLYAIHWEAQKEVPTTKI